nr:TonB-dependent hemoglobin/transferrin/lactoferrin family receptor [Bradyrhizobium lablabi]
MCTKAGSEVFWSFVRRTIGVAAVSVVATPAFAEEVSELPPIEVAAPQKKPRPAQKKQIVTSQRPRNAPAVRAPAPQPVTAPAVATGESQDKGFQGTPDWVYSTPGSVSVLSRQQIEQRTPRNSSDLFQDMSGVFTATDRQNPGTTVNIRGLQEQGRVNVMIDGARQNFQQAGHDASSFVYFDPELIGGAVVEKGPTSTVGGAGVIGGVVSLRTLEADDILLPGKNYGVRSRATAGSNEYRYTASEAVAARSDQVDVVAAVSRKETGPYLPGQNGTLQYVGPGAPVTFTGQDNWSGLGKVTWRPTPDQKFKLGYVALNNNFSTGQGEFIDTNQLFTQTATADYFWKPANQAIDLAAKAWWSSTDNHQFRPARTAYGSFDLRYGLTSFGGSLANTSRFDIPLFNVTWTNGLEYFKDQTKTGVISDQTNPSDNEWFSGPTPAGMRDISSGFSEIKFKQGEWLELIAGGRYDLYSLKGSGNFINACGAFATECTQPFSVDKSEGRFSPKVTAAVTPVKGFQVYGSYAEGFRPPQIMETLQYGRHIGNGVVFAPNPNLLPETSKNLEAGANFKFDNVFFQGDGFRAKAAVFDNTITNFITTGVGRYPQAGTFGDLVQTAFVHVNLLGPSTKIKGFELEASYDTGKAYIGGTYTRLDTRYDGVYNPFFAGPPNGNAYLPLLPKWERQYFFIFVPPKEKLALDGGVRFLDRKVTLGARMLYVAPTVPLTTPDLLLTYKQESYQLYGLYMSVAFNENLTGRINVDNLLDKAYVDAMGVPTYPAPGRTVTLSLQGKF